MATLSEAQRDKVARAFSRKISRLGWEAAYTRPAARQAVGEMDDALDSASSTINAALNAEFRDNADVAQKALMLALLAAVRTGGAFDPPEAE